MVGLLLLFALALALTGCQADSPRTVVDSSTPQQVESEPVLTLKTPEGSQDWTRGRLLNHSALERITVSDLGGYDGQKLTFEAIGLWHLFPHQQPGAEDTLQYDSQDGFSSSLPARLALNHKPEGALAYLAIENPRAPWPRLASGKGSAGPFYLVWLNPEKSNIGREEWPFQLRSLSLLPSLQSRFPGIFPSANLPSDHPVQRGCQLFVKNCFPCHTLNGQGTSRMGPDLNLPHSPTEYFQPGYLKKLVRDPQSLRQWSEAKMPPFPPEVITDAELEMLFDYFKHMAESRTSD